MRTPTRLLSLAVALVGCAAALAPAASAQTVEVTNEATSEHCTPSTCEVEVSGELAFTGHLFGIEALASDCLITYTVEIDEDGEGTSDDGVYSNHPGTSDCAGRRNCINPNGTYEEWPFHLVEQGGYFWMEGWVCLESGANQPHRWYHYHEKSFQELGTHEYEVVFANHPLQPDQGIAEEADGQLEIGTGGDQIEIIHL